MDLRIGNLSLSTPPTGPRRTPGGAPFDVPAAKDVAADVPAAPPPEVLREIEQAGRRAEELWNARRELHFEIDDASGRLVIQVRDVEGQVIRTIPPSEALDIVSGRGV
jgi:hypothetical protein